MIGKSWKFSDLVPLEHFRDGGVELLAAADFIEAFQEILGWMIRQNLSQNKAEVGDGLARSSARLPIETIRNRLDI